MKFLFIETYCQGSHAQFVQGLCACSRHQIDVVSLPGENWRWRMLAAALHMVDAIPPLDGYDGVVVTDLFNLADFKALLRQPCPPVLAYFHENQITYPQPPGDKGAYQLGIINITTALVADLVVFNSYMHRRAFLNAIPGFLNRGPDFVPGDAAGKINDKSAVLYPGVTLPDYSQVDAAKQVAPPLIVWNHRWGYDKNCEIFFEAVRALEDRGVDFRLALMGENFGRIPDAFRMAEKRFKHKIMQFGPVAGRREYEKWLKRGALVISTADQENFGIAVVEAMLMGCLPLLPERLSHPEIRPAAYHGHFLYKNKYDLIDKCFDIVTRYSHYENLRNRLVEEMKPFLWQNIAAGYDRALERLAG